MREIKFRAWDEKENKYIDIIGFYQSEMRITIWYLDDDLIPDFTNFHAKAVIIEQYTGLKDKNGKEIYEGDIVNIGEKGYAKPCKVVFIEGYFGIKTPWCDCIIQLKNYCNSVFEECIEIIGNIHDTPEGPKV